MRRSQTPRRRRRAAFTLMEVLLVVAILLILASIAAVSFSGIFGGAQEDTARSSMEAIAKGVQAFYAQHRTAPSSLDDLVQEPTGLKRKWRALLETEKIPVDPWGNAFTYSVESDATRFTIQSGGPTQDPSDDIKITKRF